MASFLEYILDSIYVFKVVDFYFFFFFFFFFCTGWSGFCCVNNGSVIAYSTLIGLPVPVI